MFTLKSQFVSFIAKIKSLNVQIPSLVLFSVGLGFFLYSLTQPYYTNQQLADELHKFGSEIEKPDYYAQESSLRTNKIKYMDLGAGLMSVAASFLIFFFSAKIKIFGDLRKVKSLNKTQTYFWANVIWLLQIPSTVVYYVFRFQRGDLPSFSDSIAIPIMQQGFANILFLIPLNLFLLLAMHKTNIKVRILYNPPNTSNATFLWEIIIRFLVVVNILILIGFISDGDHLEIPINSSLHTFS